MKASRAHLRREPREDLRRPAALEMGHRIYIVECREAPASRPCAEPANGAATLAEMSVRVIEYEPKINPLSDVAHYLTGATVDP